VSAQSHPALEKILGIFQKVFPPQLQNEKINAARSTTNQKKIFQKKNKNDKKITLEKS
jgi:hypothetical protein